MVKRVFIVESFWAEFKLDVAAINEILVTYKLEQDPRKRLDLYKRFKQLYPECDVTDISKLEKENIPATIKKKVWFVQPPRDEKDGHPLHFYSLKSRLLTRLRNERKQVKKDLKIATAEHNSSEISRLNAKQLGIKIIMNTEYGASGNKIFAHFDPDIAAAVTYLSRTLIGFLTKTLHGNTLYVDTKFLIDNKKLINRMVAIGCIKRITHLITQKPILGHTTTDPDEVKDYIDKLRQLPPVEMNKEDDEGITPYQRIRDYDNGEYDFVRWDDINELQKEYTNDKISVQKYVTPDIQKILYDNRAHTVRRIYDDYYKVVRADIFELEKARAQVVYQDTDSNYYINPFIQQYYMREHMSPIDIKEGMDSMLAHNDFVLNFASDAICRAPVGVSFEGAFIVCRYFHRKKKYYGKKYEPDMPATVPEGKPWYPKTCEPLPNGDYIQLNNDILLEHTEIAAHGKQHKQTENKSLGRVVEIDDDQVKPKTFTKQTETLKLDFGDNEKKPDAEQTEVLEIDFGDIDNKDKQETKSTNSPSVDIVPAKPKLSGASITNPDPIEHAPASHAPVNYLDYIKGQGIKCTGVNLARRDQYRFINYYHLVVIQQDMHLIYKNQATKQWELFKEHNMTSVIDDVFNRYQEMIQAYTDIAANPDTPFPPFVFKLVDFSKPMAYRKGKKAAIVRIIDEMAKDETKQQYIPDDGNRVNVVVILTEKAKQQRLNGTEGKAKILEAGRIVEELLDEVRAENPNDSEQLIDAKACARLDFKYYLTSLASAIALYIVDEKYPNEINMINQGIIDEKEGEKLVTKLQTKIGKEYTDKYYSISKDAKTAVRTINNSVKESEKGLDSYINSLSSKGLTDSGEHTKYPITRKMFKKIRSDERIELSIHKIEQIVNQKLAISEDAKEHAITMAKRIATDKMLRLDLIDETSKDLYKIAGTDINKYNRIIGKYTNECIFYNALLNELNLQYKRKSSRSPSLSSHSSYSYSDDV